jgi:NAD(P)-dependent dehydrogenase (short-subunit alcohol dehydrogenase family)
MAEPIRGRTVMVTGASAGVGRAVAEALGRHACRVGLIARGLDGLEGARRAIEAAGGAALPLPCDVADAAAVEEAAGEAERRLGPIDVWINVAMCTVYAPVWMMSAEEFRRVTEVTFLGYVHGTLAALRRMRPRDHGTIVQVGSSLAYRGIPLQSAYCAAKAAVRGFTDSLRCELIHADSAIRLTMVQLPAVNTPQFDWARNHMRRRPKPVPPVFQPETVAEAIIAAAERAPRELWVDTSTVKVILGSMAVPGALDRLLASEGWSGELSAEPEPPFRPDNLFAPLPGDHGAHGRFGDQAATHAPRFSAGLVRGAAAVAGVAAMAAALSLGMAGRRRQPGLRPS